MSDKPARNLTLPVFKIVADTLPEGWEKAVLRTWRRGTRIKTEYDRPGDPLSRDAEVFIVVRDPFAEPRIHRALPGGMYDLEVYVQEVLDGIHDDWIDPKQGKWQYTYHERMRSYKVPGRKKPVDQIAYVVNDLAEDPHSRRAQIVIWKPWEDPGDEHPACLQRMWFRIFGNELVMSIDIRSNDAYRAAFMNMFAFTALQRSVAGRLSEQLGRLIWPGQYTHHANSFHIYGSNFASFRGFLENSKTRTWGQQTYTSEEMEPLFVEARAKIAAKLAQGERAEE